MLPNHAPLVVAEQFGMLEALHPGRIDLGIGRGARAPTRSPRRRCAAPRAGVYCRGFSGVPRRTDGVLQRRLSRGHPYRRSPPCRARLLPGIWLLGSSDYSAQLAGCLGFRFRSPTTSLARRAARRWRRTATLRASEVARGAVRDARRLCGLRRDSAERADGSPVRQASSFVRLRTGPADAYFPFRRRPRRTSSRRGSGSLPSSTRRTGRRSAARGARGAAGVGRPHGRRRVHGLHDGAQPPTGCAPASRRRRHGPAAPFVVLAEPSSRRGRCAHARPRMMRTVGPAQPCVADHAHRVRGRRRPDRGRRWRLGLVLGAFCDAGRRDVLRRTRAAPKTKPPTLTERGVRPRRPHRASWSLPGVPNSTRSAAPRRRAHARVLTEDSTARRLFERSEAAPAPPRSASPGPMAPPCGATRRRRMRRHAPPTCAECGATPANVRQCGATPRQRAPKAAPALRAPNAAPGPAHVHRRGARPRQRAPAGRQSPARSDQRPKSQAAEVGRVGVAATVRDVQRHWAEIRLRHRPCTFGTACNHAAWHRPPMTSRSPPAGARSMMPVVSSSSSNVRCPLRPSGFINHGQLAPK